jgi:hypothetical protein
MAPGHVLHATPLHATTLHATPLHATTPLCMQHLCMQHLCMQHLCMQHLHSACNTSACNTSACNTSARISVPLACLATCVAGPCPCAHISALCHHHVHSPCVRAHTCPQRASDNRSHDNKTRSSFTRSSYHKPSPGHAVGLSLREKQHRPSRQPEHAHYPQGVCVRVREAA